MGVIARWTIRKHEHDDGTTEYAAEPGVNPEPCAICGAEPIIVVPEQQLQGAVDVLRALRAELVAPSGHPITSAPWCARAIEQIDAVLGEQ